MYVYCSPMGVFEMAKFEVGTKGIMDAVVAATKAGASSIIGKSTFRGLFLAIPNGLKVAQKAVIVYYFLLFTLLPHF